jgi:hypothetical protein
MSLDSDPEISAAFSGSDTPSAASSSDDPEISAAFKDTDSAITAPKPTALGTQFKHGLMDIAGSVAHGVGTLVDVGRNDVRTFEGRPNLDYGSPESTAAFLSRPFDHTPDADVSTTDPKEQIRRALPKLGDQPTVRRALDTPAGQTISEDVVKPAVDIGQAAATLEGAGALLKAPFRSAPRLTASGAPATAQSVADEVAARQSGGAAGAAPNVAAASQPIQDAIAAADPTKVDRVAMDNHLEADKNGVQLMKGQANRDPIQFSEEQNQSTHPMIAKRLKDQNEQITNRLDDIRQEASPTNVANSARENGQVAVDDLKAYDEPIRADIKARYQKLEDANGGAIPIDTGATIGNIDARLKKGSLTRTAGADPAISEVMDNLRSGQPIDFEQFESARSLLAGVQRKGGSAGVAAGIARDELEKMPLPPEAAPLKALADDARNAASSRFEALRQDPAYEAAVDDVTNGVKRGKPSPIADTFLDDYALNRGAPKSQVDLMMSKLGDEGRGAVASHTLNAVRKGGISASGNVLPNGYNSAMAKYGDKMPSLVTPEVNDSLQSLGRTITNAKVAPPGSSVAPKSGVIVRDAIQGAMEHAANAKTMGAYGVLKKVFTKDGFAKEATAPGAGIER